MKQIALLISFALLLTACQTFAPVPLSTAVYIPTETLSPPPPTPMIKASPIPAPTDLPYHLGFARMALYSPNQVSLGDQIVNGIPPKQLATEIAYLAVHSLGYENLVGYAAEEGLPDMSATPYQLLATKVKAKNILAINQDANNPDFTEIVYAQAYLSGPAADPPIAIIHVLISHDAQQAYAKIARIDANNLFDQNSISSLLSGDISTMTLLICVNKIHNPSLVKDPAFAIVKQVVDKQRPNEWDLEFFTLGSITGYDGRFAKNVTSTPYISYYASTP